MISREAEAGVKVEMVMESEEDEVMARHKT